MRILILANFDLGLYKFRKELIEELLNRGNEVYISLPDGDLVRPLEKIGCVFIDTPVDRRGINPKTDFGLLKRYKKMMKEINPDLVITYTIKPNIYGGIAARQAKKQYAVNITGLGTAFEKPGMLRALVTGLYKFGLSKVKVVFVENSEIGIEIDKYRICDANKIVVLNGAGVNTEVYGYQEYPQNQAFHFLFIGRVMKEKGIDELLSSVRRLKEEGYNCILDIVGPYEENYESKIKQYELEGYIKYYGYQKDVRSFISVCDCFVLPSYHEGMANTNLECASSGRPVITCNIPGCKEAVIEGETGYLCEPQNVESLYEVMKKMLSLSENERAKMGARGREHMVKSFEKKIVVKNTMKELLA